MSTVIETVGTNVRALRTRQGLTQAQLARRVGIVVSTVAKIELGQISSSLGVLDGVARVLGTSVAGLTAPVSGGRASSLGRPGYRAPRADRLLSEVQRAAGHLPPEQVLALVDLVIRLNPKLSSARDAAQEQPKRIRGIITGRDRG